MRGARLRSVAVQGLVTLLVVEVVVRLALLAPGVLPRLGHRLGPTSSRLLWAYSSLDRTFETWYGHDPDVGWVPKPADGTRDGVRMSVNEDGVRGPRVPRTPSPDTRRLLFLGDSFVFGWEADDSVIFPRTTAERLPGTDSVNLGVPGYDWGQLLLRWRSEGRTWEPDVVVLGVGSALTPRSVSDFFLYARPLVPAETGRLEPVGTPVPEPGTLWWHTFLTPHLVHVGRMWSWRLTDPEARATRAAERGEALLEALVDEIEATGAQAVLLYLPTPELLRAGLPAEPEREWMGRLCDDGRARCVDPSEALRDAGRAGVPLAAGTHYSAEAHGILADRLAAALAQPRSSSTVPSSPK